MKITNYVDTEFEMLVEGYQFPSIKHEQYDADWLNILVKVKHPRGIWSKSSPCMLTWELANLAKWLENIADNSLFNSEIDFMEPELSFKWFGEGKNILRIYLHYSLRPSWSPYYGKNEENELFVDFTLMPDDLRKAAASLHSKVKQFPVKVKILSTREIK